MCKRENGISRAILFLCAYTAFVYLARTMQCILQKCLSETSSVPSIQIASLKRALFFVLRFVFLIRLKNKSITVYDTVITVKVTNIFNFH